MTTTLPPMIEAIANRVSARLPAGEAPAFAAAVAAAAAGRDLSAVPWQFLGAELRSLPAQSAEVQAVVDPVIAGLDQLAAGQEWPEAAAAAISAATAAARAAIRAAIRAADWGATAAAADRAAESAAAAANWAAYAHADVTASTRRQRDLLLRLLAEA